MTEIGSESDFTTAGLNLIAQALSIYDRDLRLVVWNRPFQKMFNLPEHLVTKGAKFGDTIRYLAETGDYGPIDDIEDFVSSRIQQALAFEPHYVERTRANGRTIAVEGSPLPQGGWVTVYTDITRTRESELLLRARSAELSDSLLTHAEDLSAANRKLAATNAALEETKRQLIASEARTRLTTEMIPAHIAHVGSDGRYTYSNRRLNAVMPGKPSDIVGRPIRDALGEDTYAQIKDHLDAAFRGEYSVFEFTDTPSALRIRTAFTPDGAGGVYILSMDITEETQTRVALQQTRRRALAAQMTSGLAHDFSNLLTIVLGLQSKLSRLDLPDAAGDLVAATQEAARRGGRLINRISDMTGRRTLRPAATDLHSFLSDFKLIATPTLPQNVGLSVLDTTPDGRVMLDVGMVQDALLNLVLNARDAIGAHGQITVSAHVMADVWIVLAVNDTGPGFSDEALARAFEPFYSTKGREGSGLGLPMVYDMVKLAGGDLRLDNTPEGAAVRLRLPYRPVPDTAEGGLVLLVEDNETLRADIRDMLTDLGHSVIEATSADEAVALSVDLPDISLVLSDINLSGSGTGLDLLERLGRDGPPTILMTALPPTDPLFVDGAARVPVLQKPFSRSSLAALIHPGAAA